MTECLRRGTLAAGVAPSAGTGTAPYAKKTRASGPGLLRRLNAQRCAASERACEAALFSAATGGVLPSKAAVSWVLSTGSMRS